MQGEKSTRSNSAITDLNRLQESIFQLNNRDILIRQSINQGILSDNILSSTRQERIEQVFGNNVDNFLSTSEAKMIKEIIDLSKELKGHVKKEESEKQRGFCAKIFRLIYLYIHYRSVGIQQHIDTGNVQIFYKKNQNSPTSIYYGSFGEIYITSTFKEHKAKREKEIVEYLKKAEVMNLLSQLASVAPSLFYQRQTFEEFLNSRNPFSEPGVGFVEPPFLIQMNELLKTIICIQSNQYKIDHLDIIDSVIAKFNTQKDYNYICAILYKIYTPIECLAFWPQDLLAGDQEIRFFKICLSTGLFFSNKISYDLLDISEAKIKEAMNIIANTENTLTDKIMAGRILKYSPIPWYLLQNISALTINPKKFDNLPIENIIFAAHRELALSWQSLLPFLQNLITYEISVSVAPEQIDFMKMQRPLLDISQYMLLKNLGDYAGDVLFLHKVISILSELNLDQPLLAETHLRLLGILGECAKNFSPHIKKLMGNNYWEMLAKTRDKALHTTGFLYRLQRILESNLEYTEGLKEDLKCLLKLAQSLQQKLPASWDEVKVFYSSNQAALPSHNAGKGLNKLLEALDSILAEEDYKELRETKNCSRNDLTAKRGQILKVVNQEIKADSMSQKDFFDLAESLTSLLSNKQIKEIKEIYKNLRQGKVANLTPAILKALQNIESIPDSELANKMELLIKRLRSFKKLENLEEELAKLGLLSAKEIWQEKWEKFQGKPKNTAKPTSTVTRSLDHIISDSTKAAKKILEHLELLRKLVLEKDSNQMIPLEQFWKDSNLCHAVEFYFTRIRIYIDVIQEALGYLPHYGVLDEAALILNELYHLLELKLKNMRLYGNALAHLHDVTKLDGRTTHGHRFSAYQEVWSATEDYKVINSLAKHLTNYIQKLDEITTKKEKARISKITDNRKNYLAYYKWQQQALTKLPHLKLSDYQILVTFDKIDENDPDKKVKQQIYNATKELLRLHQESINLEKLQPSALSTSKSASSSHSVKKCVTVANKKLTFEEKNVIGDGWCTLNAAGIVNPETTINNLKNHLNDPSIVNYIRRALENNYHANQMLHEEFNIEGNDANGDSIKSKIKTLYMNCQTADANNSQHLYLQMMSYFELKEVQIAYLNYLLKTRYVDSNIASACLALQGKKLALFIDYDLPNGQLVNATEDNISPDHPNTVCLVFHPNSRQALSHYNILQVIQTEPINQNNPVLVLQAHLQKNSQHISQLQPI